jgi:deoxyribose-phosphate aldolase
MFLTPVRPQNAFYTRTTVRLRPPAFDKITLVRFGKSQLSAQDIAGMVDHTKLTYKDHEDPEQAILKLCAEAKQNNFGAVCVRPDKVQTAKAALRKTGVQVATVIGFPDHKYPLIDSATVSKIGSASRAEKVAEAREALQNGADELDMVMNVAQFKQEILEGQQRHGKTLDEFRQIKQLAGKRIVKVILETDLLTREEIVEATRCCAKAGVDFVKTSTGMIDGGVGATVETVRLIAKTLKRLGQDGKIGIKASGGIKNAESARQLIAAGATRLGTSSGVEIVTEKSSGKDSFVLKPKAYLGPPIPKISKAKRAVLEKAVKVLKKLEENMVSSPFSAVNQIYRILYPRELGVVIYGSSRPLPGTEEYEFARQVGAAIGNAKIGKQFLHAVSGGNRGAMQAVGEGALSVGSHSIGANLPLPGQEPDPQYYPELIVHETIPERLNGVGGYDHRGAYTVAVAGGVGTYEELFGKIVGLMADQTLYPCQKRIVLADPHGEFTKPNGLIDLLKQSIADGKTNPWVLDSLIQIAKTPDEVVKLLLEPGVPWTPGKKVDMLPSNHFPGTAQA